METFTYKTAGDCALKADVYRAGTDRAAGRIGERPVVVAIHGGALIMGGRHPIQMELFKPLLDRGCVVVSIDYRLAPETKLPEIVEDVQDAFGWIREAGPELFGADPGRIGVQGSSAGGYLTLMTGFCVAPRPLALVSHFGYGDIIGEWYSRPDPYYCGQPPVPEDAARRAVGDRPTANGDRPGNRRHDFYLYCRQQGLWPLEVAGFDPATQPEAFTPYCPVQNVTPAYPPTLLAHGDQDDDVPCRQSVIMDAALARAGVEHEFITLHGAGHGFVHAGPEDCRNVMERSAAFLARHLSVG